MADQTIQQKPKAQEAKATTPPPSKNLLADADGNYKLVTTYIGQNTGLLTKPSFFIEQLTSQGILYIPAYSITGG